MPQKTKEEDVMLAEDWLLFLFDPQRHHNKKRVIIKSRRIGVHIRKLLYGK